jgi:O-antigen/teichoic acid export membrane protein
VSVVLVLFYQYFVQNQLDINSYLYAYLAGQLTLLIFTLPLAIKIGFTSVKFNDLKRAFLALTQAGFLIQLGNVFQFGVYRINYLILEVFVSTSSLGVFSLGNQLSEKTLIPVNATSMVQYIEVSNTEDLNKALQITINVLVLAQIVSTLSVTLLVVIPQNVISFLFGEEFGESSILFPILGLGIFFLANSTIISHYFSGLGKFKINTIISFFGAIATIGVGFSIIPQYGIIGAAWTSSIVFGAQAIINFFVFKQVSKITWGKFINIYGASLKSAPNRLIQKLKN